MPLEHSMLIAEQRGQPHVLVRLVEGDDTFEKAQVWIDGWQVPPAMAKKITQRQHSEDINMGAYLHTIPTFMTLTIEASLRVDQVDVEMLPPGDEDRLPVEQDEAHGCSVWQAEYGPPNPPPDFRSIEAAQQRIVDLERSLVEAHNLLAEAQQMAIDATREANDSSQLRIPPMDVARVSDLDWSTLPLPPLPENTWTDWARIPPPSIDRDRLGEMFRAAIGAPEPAEPDDHFGHDHRMTCHGCGHVWLSDSEECACTCQDGDENYEDWESECLQP